MASIRKAAARERGRKYSRRTGTTMRQSTRAVSSDAEPRVMLDEPSLLGAQENPETDIASTVLSHPIADRSTNVESDAAPSAMDDLLPGAFSADPNVCPERDAKPENAEDLH